MGCANGRGRRDGRHGWQLPLSIVHCHYPLSTVQVRSGKSTSTLLPRTCQILLLLGYLATCVPYLSQVSPKYEERSAHPATLKPHQSQLLILDSLTGFVPDSVSSSVLTLTLTLMILPVLTDTSRRAFHILMLHRVHQSIPTEDV